MEPSALPHEVWGRADLRYSGRGTRVVVLGDDALRSAEGDLRRVLAGYAVKVAAITGEGFTGGPRSSVDPAASMIEIARTYGEDQPSRVVIALGFNDVRPDRPGHEAVMKAANDVFDQFDRSCIVGVTIDADAPVEGFRRVRAGALNTLIRERSDRVVNWNSMSHEAPDLLGTDGFTPSPAGAEVLTQAIRTSVEACT